MFAPGAVIACQYRLERQLGEGGMGVVWAAQDIASKRRVALKFLRDVTGSDARAQERFVREARAAMTIAHPNVARVEAALETEAGAPFIVMELLEGESLRDRLRRLHVLGLGECARIVVSVVDAVGAAHEKRIVHRDLKPENVFVLANGDVRVLDFGIAKQLPREVDGTASQSLTTTGSLLGTPLYMAPEQLFGDDVDVRADVWALGIMIYECLTGSPPTAGDGFGPVIKRITTEPLVPLAEARPGLPTSIALLVDRMLSRDRAMRPPLAEVRAAFAAATTITDAPPSPLAMSYAGSQTPQHRAVNAPAMLSSSGAPFAPTIDPAALRARDAVASHALRAPYAPTLDPVRTTAGAVQTPPRAEKKSRLGLVLGIGGALVVVLLAIGAGVVAWTQLTTARASAPPPFAGSSLAAYSNALIEAGQALGRRDGAACLKAYDQADRVTPTGTLLSTDPKSPNAIARAHCLMLAGDCEHGKALYTSYYQTNPGSGAIGGDGLVTMVEYAAAMYCEGNKLAPRDELLRADLRLQQVRQGQRSATLADCNALHDTEQRLLPKVPARGITDRVSSIPQDVEPQYAVCLAYAGSCDDAFRIYRAWWIPAHESTYAPAEREPYARKAYDDAVSSTKCRAPR
jgi:serine/threonine-protein kinase